MRKKKILIIGIVIVFFLIVVGAFTNYIDGSRVRTNHEPKFCIKTISSDGSKVTGVRIDIWTHFMRKCIINYVH